MLRKVEIENAGRGLGRLTGVLLDSPNDLLAVRDPDYPHRANGALWRSRAPAPPERGSWMGNVSNLKQAEALLTEGWPAGVARAQGLLADLEHAIPEAKQLTRRVRYRDAGDEVDTGRYLSGAYDTMWRSMPRDAETTGNKIVSVNIAYGGPCLVQGDDLFWSGAAAAVLVDHLEAAGFRVELFASCKIGARSGPDSVIVRTRLKDAGEPLRLDSAIAFVGHPAVYRFWTFLGWTACTSYLGDSWGSGARGYNSGPALAALAEAGHIDAPDITFEPFYTREDAVRQVKEALRKIEDIAGREVAL